MMNASPWRSTLAAVAVLAVLPAFLADYLLFQASITLTYAIAILGLNLLMGFNGQISLAQGVFFAMGGYATAVLAADYGVSFWVAIPLAAAMAAALGAVIGIPALRLQGLQLAIITLVLAALVPSLILRFPALTKGTSGIALDKPDVPAWLPIGQDAALYLVCVAAFAVCAALILAITTGETGRRLRSVRDNPVIAEAFGIHVARTKVAAFATSAGLGGLAGGLFALVSAFVSADSFQLFKSFEFLAGAIIGGITSVVGALLGAIVVVFLPEWSATISPGFAGVVYGGTLIVMMLVAREGLAGLAAKIAAAVTARLPTVPNDNKKIG